MPWEIWLVVIWLTAFMVTASGGLSLIGSRHFVPLGFKKELVRTSALVTFVTAILLLAMIEINAGIVREWNLLPQILALNGGYPSDDAIIAGNIRGVIISVIASIGIAIVALVGVARMDRGTARPI